MACPWCVFGRGSERGLLRFATNSRLDRSQTQTGTGVKACPCVACKSSGGWIRTSDLRVMSPTSYQAALPRNLGAALLGPLARGSQFVGHRVARCGGLRLCLGSAGRQESTHASTAASAMSSTIRSSMVYRLDRSIGQGHAAFVVGGDDQLRAVLDFVTHRGGLVADDDGVGPPLLGEIVGQFLRVVSAPDHVIR